MNAKTDLIGKITVQKDTGNFNDNTYGNIDVLLYKNRGYDFILEQGIEIFGLTRKQAIELRNALDEMLEWD